jgi:hypothetical protein
MSPYGFARDRAVERRHAGEALRGGKQYSGMESGPSVAVAAGESRYDRSGADVLKNELSAGVLPCGRFGANAAWLRLAVLTYNTLTALKRLALPAELLQARPKRLRFLFFGSEREFVKSGILRGFPDFVKRHVFDIAHGHALCFQ